MLFRSPACFYLRCTIVLLAVLAVPCAHAQDTKSLARDIKNPFAKLPNLQVFYDANLNTGPQHQTQHVVNVRPVIPFDVGTDWSLITRSIFPVIAQPGTAPGSSWTTGPGDSMVAAFLSPAQAEHFVWGLGPVLQIPTVSNDALG